jgi:pimeloyl-ACP methyl ester carboxylesterase
MSTFVLIHGAADVGWYWHLLEAELRQRGHEVVAPDLPCDDDAAGLNEYADTVVEAVGDHSDLVIVGQSFGAFTAPLVADRLGATALVYLAGMIPKPGETPGEWWDVTEYGKAVEAQRAVDGVTGDDDPYVSFYNGVPRELADEAMSKERAQSQTPMGTPWPLAAYPEVPTYFLLCGQDQFFPVDFFRNLAKQRLNVVADEIDAGHCVALSKPKELADVLEGYAKR